MRISTTRISGRNRPQRGASAEPKVKSQQSDVFQPQALGESGSTRKSSRGHNLAMTACGAVVGFGVGMLTVGFGLPILAGLVAGGAVTAGAGVLSFSGRSEDDRSASVVQTAREKPSPQTAFAPKFVYAAPGPKQRSTTEARAKSEDPVSDELESELETTDVFDKAAGESKIEVVSLDCQGCGAPVAGSGSCGHCGSQNLLIANGQIIL